jgi:predicted RNA-binding protein with PUA-like domain
MVANYWIFKVEDEVGGLFGRRGYVIFDHRTSEGFWAIREHAANGKLEAKASQLQKGDYALFFLVDKDGSQFVGTCMLDSGFMQLSEEQAKNLVHREFIDWNQGVFIKDVDKWAEPLPIKYLREKESFRQSGVKVGTHFQGRIKKIEQKDYVVILHEHELF